MCSNGSGSGPDVLIGDNPKLVYGRMTGWGQDGPYARAAGHDINYIALSGVLHTIGRADERPVPPVNYIGDFGGGGMMLAFGMVAALLAVKAGGGGPGDRLRDDGRIGVARGHDLFGACHWRARGPGGREPARWGGAPFYDTYACADGRFIAIGSIEPPFYALLRAKTGLDADPDFDAQYDRAMWPELKARVAAVIARKTRDEWDALMAATDVCFAPVLSLAEAPLHPHNVERGTFVEVGGSFQPGPAPRYSVTVNDAPRVPPVAGADNDAVLAELGYDADGSRRCARRVRSAADARQAIGDGARDGVGHGLTSAVAAMTSRPSLPSAASFSAAPSMVPTRCSGSSAMAGETPRKGKAGKPVSPSSRAARSSSSEAVSGPWTTSPR